MTTIAELFVTLGVKGSDKTLSSIDSMKKGLKDTASVSLEAKAAIIGAMYALERLFAASGQAGTDLTNFNASLGVSAQTLQQYQYAARQAGVSNKETEATFKSLQSTMTKTLMGEGAPKGLARVSMLTGGITAEDIQKFAKSPQLLIQRLQEYAAKETNAGLRNEVLKSFGIGDQMAAALSRQAFRPNVLQQAPTYKDSEIQQLDKANIAWSNLGTKIEMAIGHFNAQHGGQLVGDISKMVDEVLKLAGAFEKLSEKAKLFEWLDKIFQGWKSIFEGLTEAIDLINAAKVPEDKGSAFANAVSGNDANGKPRVKSRDELDEEALERSFAEAVQGVFTSLLSGVAPTTGPDRRTPTEQWKDERQAIIDAIKASSFNPGERSTPPKLQLVPPQSSSVPTAQAVRPNAPAVQSSGTTQVNVNQNLNFSHEGKDAKQTGDSTKQAVKEAFRQLPALGQGS